MRNTDKFLYATLKNAYANNQKALIDTLKLIFGKGVAINSFPTFGGNYTGEQEVDVLTRLAIAFLDGFETVKVMSNQRERQIAAASSMLSQEFASDILRFMNEYHRTMPTQAFTYHLQALLNFEFFIYTLKLVCATNALVSDATQVPPAFLNEFTSTPPWLYLDFTQEKKGISHTMAQICVRRDIEAYQRFVYSSLYLRQLHAYSTKLQRNPHRKEDILHIMNGETKGAGYILGLRHLLEDPALRLEIDAQARNDEDAIINANKGEDEEDPREIEWIDDIASAGETDLDRVIHLLAEAQQDMAINHYIQWYHHSGGLRKPYGIMAGELKSRLSWCYAPSNDLLAVLVQVAAVRLNKGQDPVKPIRLIDFLTFLKDHYGIIIDHPPEMVSGTEYLAAAQENVHALQNRLRQMGIFRGMSDDFTAQYLYPPYAPTAHA